MESKQKDAHLSVVIFGLDLDAPTLDLSCGSAVAAYIGRRCTNSASLGVQAQLQTMELAAENRPAMYKRRDVRLLLSWTLNGHENIVPTLTEAGYTYPEINLLLEVPDSTPLLEELSSHQFYNKTVVDMDLACPTCGSSRTIRDSYSCPFCNNREIQRGTLIEHYACGYVNFMETYARGNDWVCPKCGKTLRLIGVDYRKIENVFRCRSCQRDFADPRISHHCVKCKQAFTSETSKLNPVYSYKFNEDFRQEVMANCVIELPLVNLLKENGFEVESPGLMKGESGIDYPFDIVATRDGERFAYMIATHAREVGEDAVIGFFAKIFDSKPEKSIMIVIPKLSAGGSKLARLYGIGVIEGGSLEEVLKGMRKSLSEIEQKAPVSAVAKERPPIKAKH